MSDAGDRCPLCREESFILGGLVDARARVWCRGCAASALAAIDWPAAGGAAELQAKAAELLRKPSRAREIAGGERCPSTTGGSGAGHRCELAIGHAPVKVDHRGPWEHMAHVEIGGERLPIYWNDAPPPEELRQLRASYEADEAAARAKQRQIEQEAAERERLQRAEREKNAQQKAAEAPPAPASAPTAEERDRRFSLLELE